MKRSLFLRLALVPMLALATAACGSDDDDTNGTDTGGTDTGGSDTGGTDTGGTDTGSDTADDTTADAGVDAAVDTGGDTAAGSPTLDEVHSAIFATTCAGVGCHIGAFPGAGLDLTLDEGLLDRLLAPSTQSELALIEPGSADDSYLFLKITGEHTLAGGSGTRMPPAGSALPSEQVDLLRDYIETTLAAR
jgi:hypothetical protein